MTATTTTRAGTAPVVTGLAAIAANGIGTDAYWAATLAGHTGLGPITRFDASRYPVRRAGEVRDFVAGRYLSSRLIVQTDHWTHLGLVAAQMALCDAGIVPESLPEYAAAVITASSSGGNALGQREIQSLWRLGPEFVSVYQSIGWFYAATTGQVSILHGLKGPCGVIVTEQAGGLDAIGQARRVLREDATVVVTGGTEAPVGPYALTCQLPNGRLSRRDDARAYIPFDVAASGYVPGEGGAMLILEQPAAARRRGAHVYGEIAGYAAAFDPPAGSGRAPGLARAIEAALADAGAGAGDVDVVFADAAAVPELDRQEAEALATVFGPRGVPVTAPKTMTGRLYAGGAALDLATALLALRDQVIPPTVAVRAVRREYALDLVRGEARSASLRAALVLARGYGGFNAAVLVRRVRGWRTPDPSVNDNPEGEQ
jgi:act minimal PKS chain-length factor (CLF/KS beta)